MNLLRNRVQLIGHLGKDPEVKDLADGKKVARFSIATNSEYRNGEGEQVRETQWHNLVAWDKRAEILEKYVTKGQEICVEGKLTSRTYEGKDGSKKYFTEIVVQDFLLLGKKS